MTPPNETKRSVNILFFKFLDSVSIQYFGILPSMTAKVLVTRKKVEGQLLKVMDPEMSLSIVDLGLVYNIAVSKIGNVHILMTLTSMGCPLFGIIEEDIYVRLAELGLSRKQITIEMTFDPPWDLDRLTKRAKATLGI